MPGKVKDLYENGDNFVEIFHFQCLAVSGSCVKWR